MKSLGNCIALTTGVMIVYVVCSTLPVAFPIVFWLFLLSQGLLIWMVIRILKDDKKPSGKTFDTHFYEDSPIRRNYR
jgi:4-hydroxybenzoate polyprenyltransferase